MTREEAIKIIKEFVNGTCLHLVDQEALETLIPELKESDDERIRKAIVKSIEEDSSVYEQEVSKEQMLAWLEKQKENPDRLVLIGKAKSEKQVVLLAESNGDENIYWDTKSEEDAVSLLEKGLKFFGMQKPSDLSEMMVHKEPCIAPVPTPMVADEQKPVEIDEYKIIKKHITEDFLSSEVNKRLKECGWYVTDEKPAEWDGFDKDCLKRAVWYIENPAPSVVKDTNLALWLKSLPGRFNFAPKQESSEREERLMKALQTSNAQIAELVEENYNLKETKQEWSEKDEDMRDKIISDLEWERRNTTVDKDIRHYDEELHWLKSLKPQSHSEWRHYIWAINMRFDFTALIKYDNTDDYEIVQAGNRPKQEKNGIYILIKDIKHQFHWKPSKEQMEALERTIHLANFGLEVDRKKALESLYEQIKKL